MKRAYPGAATGSRGWSARKNFLLPDATAMFRVFLDSSVSVRVQTMSEDLPPPTDPFPDGDEPTF